MKLHILLVVAFAAGIVACAEKEEAATAVTEAPAAEPEATAAVIEDWRNSALLDHMHAHAEQLDDINFALDDGDLDRVTVPAYWLSRHKTVSGIPENLQPFVDGMREAARAVETAEDLVAARAAAQQISVQCQGCHAAVGVSTQ